MYYTVAFSAGTHTYQKRRIFHQTCPVFCQKNPIFYIQYPIHYDSLLQPVCIPIKRDPHFIKRALKSAKRTLHSAVRYISNILSSFYSLFACQEIQMSHLVHIQNLPKDLYIAHLNIPSNIPPFKYTKSARRTQQSTVGYYSNILTSFYAFVAAKSAKRTLYSVLK